jgi:hypothetical protein
MNTARVRGGSTRVKYYDPSRTRNYLRS